ncbi:uncharacterized protein LOC119162026 [Rhipicephalus microplus]|uniref:uncharacterized protein LOC119162026 n=1 Tax=Rhipicephalus microplus TaxID=6941 RepID=UPI003F6C21A2
MGDESVASGVSSAPDPGAPPAAVGAAPTAEGIMKKLSNYWLIVGSIPLVMFLLVCLPTVFYVKSISEYKNAFYCRSKACDALALTTKAVRDAKPCDDYFTSVCKAAPLFDVKNVLKKDKNFMNKAATMWGDNPPAYVSLIQYYGGCTDADKNGPGAVTWAWIGNAIGVPSIKDAMAKMGQGGSLRTDITRICTNAVQHGIDCMFHFEWMRGATQKAFSKDPKPTIGEALPTPAVKADLAISAPDMGIMEPSHYLVDLGGQELSDIFKPVVEALKDMDDNLDEDVVAAFEATAKGVAKRMYELMEYSKDLDYTVAPRMMDTDAFSQVDNDMDGFNDYHFISFAEAVKNFVPAAANFNRFLVRSPNYVDLLNRALNYCPAGAKCYITMDEFYVFIFLDTTLRIGGNYVVKGVIPDDVRLLWCSRYIDWMLPTAMASSAENYLQKTYWPFGLKNPKDPKNPHSAFTVGMQFTQMLLDAFAHSYALSIASSEKSRANLYTKMLQLDYMAFYPNSSDKPNQDMITKLNSKIVPSDEFSLVSFFDNRKEIFSNYWKSAETDLKDGYIQRFPMMYSDDVGSYDYGTNLMFIPFGMFRPSFYRDSTAYMGNYAVFGYYGSKNILKMLNNAGSYSKAGYNFPLMWPGTYAVGKMNAHYRCFNPARTNLTVKSRLLAEGNNPISPGFRYFRKQALIRAHPRPEYRLDEDAKADMEQIYLTAVMRTYCRYKGMKADINTMFQHDLYYQTAYCADGGKMKMDPAKMCYIWHSTRRSY